MMCGYTAVRKYISTMLAAGLVTGCASSATVTRPTVPEAIEAPATAVPVHRWFAKGTQDYTCTAKADGSGADWKLTAPAATLYASADEGAAQVGIHGAGPTWAATDGTRFVGDAATAKKAPSPNPSAVPWLLVPKKDGDTTGTLGGVSYVQRLDTVGGQPPATGCDTTTVGATVKVPYSATYVFYRST
jgi:hypothetical protein